MQLLHRMIYGIILALPLVAAAVLFFYLSRPVDKHAAWNALVDEFFSDVYFKIHPSLATAAGVHEYDAQLEDYSSEAVLRTINILHRFENRVHAICRNDLTELEAGDRSMLLGEILSMLLSYESIRTWQKDPDYYSTGIAKSIYCLLRPFASAAERLRLVIARERQMPAVFSAARANLENPPRIYTQLALEQLAGNIKFFSQDVPKAFQDVSDAKLKEEFTRTNAAVIAALKDYDQWLRSYLLDRSKGDFRIGAENLSKKLLYEEMVTDSLDELLKIGWTDLRKNQAEFARIARKLEPTKSSRSVLELLEKLHPTPDRLLSAFRETFDDLITFIRKKRIITIPAGPHPVVREAPPIDQTTTYITLDPAGAYETVATDAYFNVTPPGAYGSPEKIESYLRAFNIGTIFSVSIHETYPGHYVQYLWTKHFPSKVRKLLAAATNQEGWAHYCEQMMLDEGYGQPGFGAKDEREADLIRLGFLQEMLMRDARLIVSISMHAGTMTLDEAIKFLENEGYQPHVNAVTEAQRGISDPMYLCYTLGKLEIMEMREEYKKKLGSAFTLEKFHNEFIKQGFPPLPLVRQALFR